MCNESNFHDFVESLNTSQLIELEREIRYRKFKIKLGGNNFFDVASNYDRKPICPKCKSDKFIKFGLNKKVNRDINAKNAKQSIT